MTKRTVSLFVLTLLIVAMFAMVTEASRVQDELAGKLKAYAVLIEDPTIPNSNSKGYGGTSALGAYDIDGNSPGSIVFRSYYDFPKWYDAGDMIDWRHSAKIHMIQMGQLIAGNDETVAGRWPHYNMFDATSDVFIGGTAGVPMLSSPFTFTAREPQIDVDELGRGISIYHSYIPVATGEEGNQRTADIIWDIDGAAMFLSDTVPQSISQNPEGSVAYPFIEYQENGGTYVTHVLATEFSKLVGEVVEPIRATTYWRRVGGNGTLQGWTSPLQIEETGGGNAKICAGRTSQKVSIVYLGDHTNGVDTAGSMPFVVHSTDMGATWGTIFPVINFDWNVDGWVGWVDIEAAYDTDDYLHIVWNTMQYDAATHTQVNSVNPTRILHWTDRVAGTHAGGTLGIVAHVEFNFSSLCGRGWTNVTNTGRQVMGVCNGRLYVFWQQFGDPEFGDSLDCVDEEILGFTGSYNSEIMMSVSLSEDGSLWDRRRNITNSHSPGCDGTSGNECDSDQYPSVSRFGMDVASLGTTYWSSVPEAFEVRDVLDNTWPNDGHYLDLMFIDDAFPDNTRWSTADPVVWTNNPIKWVRIPCVPPVIEPSINVLGASYLYPLDWVKSGDEDQVTLTVENLGNAVLNVNDIYFTIDDAPGGAVTVPTTTMSVAPSGTEDIIVTINPGGFIDPAVGAAVLISGTVDFASDDPNRPLVSWTISTVVTDSVVQIVWDTIATDAGYGLIVSNHGNSGRAGEGKVNLDFVNTGDECTALDDEIYTEDVYMYSSTPLVMQSATNFSWNPFYSVFDPKPYNFQPVPNAVESDNNQNQYMSGSFVTSDSAIGFVKTSMVPKTGFTNPGTGFVVEQMKIYSADGGTYNDVMLGAWMDWDVPSDTGSNNFGGVEQADDYAWMRGLEYEPGAEGTCIDSDGRYSASGLLGYYTTTEYAGNSSVNHVGLNGAYVHLDSDEFEEGTDSLIVDSVWAWLNRGEFTANNTSAEDQQIMLSYGAFDIAPGDTLVLYTFHATMYNGDATALAGLVDEAKVWYMANREEFGVFGCCGMYTGGYPGNTNFDTAGLRDLADITKLIDNVYITKAPLLCPENGNVNGDAAGLVNLADITKLIDHVYISKAEVPPCI